MRKEFHGVLLDWIKVCLVLPLIFPMSTSYATCFNGNTTCSCSGTNPCTIAGTYSSNGSCATITNTGVTLSSSGDSFGLCSGTFTPGSAPTNDATININGGNASIFNSGTLNTFDAFGYNVFINSSGTVNITNNGSFAGATDVTSGIIIDNPVGLNYTINLTNNGSISGNTGNSFSLTDGSFRGNSSVGKLNLTNSGTASMNIAIVGYSGASSSFTQNSSNNVNIRSLSFIGNNSSLTVSGSGNLITSTSGTAITIGGTIGTGETLTMSGTGSIVTANTNALNLGNATIINLSNTGTIGTVAGTQNTPIGVWNGGGTLNVSTSAITQTYVAPTINNSAGGSLNGLKTLNITGGAAFTPKSYALTATSGQVAVSVDATSKLYLTSASSALSGAGQVSNSGVIFHNTNNALPTGTFTQASTGSLNIGAAYTTPGTFTNSGNVYLINNGSGSSGVVTGGLSGDQTASLFFVGKDSGNTFTTAATSSVSGTISNFKTMEIFNNSTLTMGGGLTSVNTSANTFTIDAGSTAILSSGQTFTLSTFAGSSLTNNGNLKTQGTWNIPATFTNTGAIFVDGSGRIVGAIPSGGTNLNIGSISPAAFTAEGTIAIQTINISNGSSLTTTSLNPFAISGVSGGLNIGTSTSSGSAATLNGTYAGTGAVSNYGTLTINNTFSSGSITVQDTATLTSSGSNTTTVTGTLTVGTSNPSTAQATFGAPYSGSSTVGNNGTLTIQNTFNSGAITNNASANLVISGSGTISSSTLNNAGNLKVQNAFTLPGTFTNTGAIYVDFTGSGITGNIPAGGTTLNVGSISPVQYSTGGTIAIQIINITNGSSLTTSGANSISGVSGGLNIGTVGSPGGAATFAATYTGTGAVASYGNLTISNSFTSGAITSFSSSGIVTLQANANLSNTLNINAGQLNVTGNAQSAAINNAGAMTVNPSVTLTSTGDIGNTGTIAVNGAISMSGHALTSTGGAITLSGSALITTGTYTSSGTHTTSVIGSSAGAVGILNASGAVNLAAANLVVNSSVNTGGPWTLITAGGGLTPPLDANITLPGSNWRYTANPTSFVVFVQGINIFPAVGPINTAIYNVVLAMSQHITNAGQQTLISALSNASSQVQFNSWLQQLMPNNNATTPSVFLQDKIFRKVERRIASLDDSIPGLQTGITAGDLIPGTSMWMSGFGSIARLAPNFWGENLGYISKSYGSIVGFDTTIGRRNTFGLGLGLSRTIVFEFSNPHFNTNIVGYHAVMYGKNLQSCDRFLEWLLTGALTDNKGSRQVVINNVVMSTTSSYRGGQGAARINYGKEFNCADYFSLAPVGSLQYVLAYQPNYAEAISPAALNVQPRNYQSVLTLGAGARLSFPYDDWWLLGVRELRAGLTYDAISSNNNVTANFVVGSPNFILTNAPPARLAFKTGIDFGLSLAECLHLVLSYDYEVRHGYYDQSANAKLKLIF